MIAEARAAILERAGSGDGVLAAAVAHLVTETSEFRLTQLLDAALGGDRRKLDRFFGGGDMVATVRAAHGLAEGETATSIAGDFCGALAREIETLKQAQTLLATGSIRDQEGAERLAFVVTEGIPPTALRVCIRFS
jgi:hypothetical protein